MRRIGTPDYLPYAVMLATLELVPHIQSPAFLTAIRAHLRDEMFREFLDSPKEARNKVHVKGFANAFVWKCDEFFQKSNISKQTDARLSNISHLGNILGIKVDLIFDYIPQQVGERNVSVGIGIIRQNCFILYKTFTSDSFVILPCGHLQLRFAVFQALQQVLQSRTIAGGEKVNVEVCKVCRFQYTPNVFPMLYNNELTLPPQLDSTEPRSFICVACQMRIGRQHISTVCGCSQTVCMNCMIIARADRNPTYCPGCSNKVSSTTEIERAARGIENIANLLTKDWGQGKVVGPKQEKLCFKCNQKKHLDVFERFGDHLDCWVCSTCIEKTIRKGSTVCLRCEQEYNSSNPKFQELVNASAKEESKTLPQAKTRNLLPIQGGRSDQQSSTISQEADSSQMETDTSQKGHPLMTSEESKTIVKPTNAVNSPIPMGVDDPLRMGAPVCTACKRSLREGQIVTFLDDTCSICVNCIGSQLESQNCLGCHKRYSVRDSLALQTRGARGEVPTFMCSKCKMQAPLNCQHPCVERKPLCVDCCIMDIILRHTSRTSACSQCRSNFYEVLSIDTDVKGYQCSGCQVMMSLYGIAHRCEQTRNYFCFPCFKFDNKSKTKQCRACKATINNKLFGQAGVGSYLPRS
jgi:hypothetical protein